METEPDSWQDGQEEVEEQERKLHLRRQASTCQRKQRQSYHPAEGRGTISAILGPNKGHRSVEKGVEQKHPLPQTGTWQLEGLRVETGGG